jgi:hypothetical protein
MSASFAAIYPTAGVHTLLSAIVRAAAVESSPEEARSNDQVPLCKQFDAEALSSGKHVPSFREANSRARARTFALPAFKTVAIDLGVSLSVKQTNTDHKLLAHSSDRIFNSTYMAWHFPVYQKCEWS